MIYDGGVFGDASAPAYQGASALASSPGSEKWYASAHTATPGFVGLAQHGPAWSSQALEAKGAPRAVAAAVLQEGTLATATVDVVYGDSGLSYIEPLYLGRTRLAAGVETQRDIVIAEENIEIVADTDGVRTCVVWCNRLAQSLPLSDRLLGVCHLEGAAEGEAEVIMADDGQGYAPDVAVLGAEKWVVHISYTDSASWRARLRVEHHDGTGWSRIGPFTADGTSAVEPRIGRRAGVGPVIAYRYETDLTRLVWWDGTGFVSPTELPALISDSLQSLDIIADDTPDGRVWVVRGTTNGRLLITSVDLATEDTGTTTCETCVELFDITGAESPIVTAAAHNSGRVVLVSYKSNAGNDSVLHTWECSGAACLCASPPCARVVASLSAAMQPMRYDRALGWVAASDPAHLVNGSLVRNRLAAAFDSQGRLRLGIQYRDYDLTWGSYNYGLVIEGGDGVLRLYPAVPSGNDDALAIDLIVGPNDKARLFWPEYRTGRVFALAEDDL